MAQLFYFLAFTPLFPSASRKTLIFKDAYSLQNLAQKSGYGNNHNVQPKMSGSKTCAIYVQWNAINHKQGWNHEVHCNLDGTGKHNVK